MDQWQTGSERQRDIRHLYGIDRHCDVSLLAHQSSGFGTEVGQIFSRHVSAQSTSASGKSGTQAGRNYSGGERKGLTTQEGSASVVLDEIRGGGGGSGEERDRNEQPRDAFLPRPVREII
jgi:hypothetical protein